jgi:hypothetical protein
VILTFIQVIISKVQVPATSTRRSGRAIQHTLPRDRIPIVLEWVIRTGIHTSIQRVIRMPEESATTSITSTLT